MPRKITPIAVANRLQDAADTLRRLPRVVVGGYGSYWPDIVREFAEAYGYNDVEVRLGPPSADAITRMDECFDWIRLLNDRGKSRLLWMRACKIRWRVIAMRMRRSERSLRAEWMAVICELAADVVI